MPDGSHIDLNGLRRSFRILQTALIVYVGATIVREIALVFLWQSNMVPFLWLHDALGYGRVLVVVFALVGVHVANRAIGRGGGFAARTVLFNALLIFGAYACAQLLNELNERLFATKLYVSPLLTPMGYSVVYRVLPVLGVLGAAGAIRALNRRLDGHLVTRRGFLTALTIGLAMAVYISLARLVTNALWDLFRGKLDQVDYSTLTGALLWRVPPLVASQLPFILFAVYLFVGIRLMLRNLRCAPIGSICPNCGYELREGGSARCPECGWSVCA